MNRLYGLFLLPLITTTPGVSGEPLIAKAQSLQPVPIVVEAPAAVVESVYGVGQVATPDIPSTTSQGLTGTLGYASPFGNCVLEVPIGIRPNGNPITWAVTSQSAHIGSVALFRFNHVGIVVGIWSNGDLEIAHQNWHGGNQHRFPASTFRGFR